MRKVLRITLPGLFALVLAAGSLPASAQQPDEHSPNMTLLANRPQSAFTNSDLAFWGNRLYAGNYGGFRIFDISNPANPTIVADVSCPGPQNDVSVWNNDADPAADLLFLSVDTPRAPATPGDPESATTCGQGPSRSAATGFAANPAEWEGVRIFDINTEANPVQLDAVPTDCGSHTHTLVPTAANNFLYIYVSSYPLGAAAVTNGTPRLDGTECEEPEPGITGKVHNKISIIKIALATVHTSPETSWEVIEHTLPGAGEVTHFQSGPRSFDFTGCHDISAFIELNLAVGACWKEVLLWDISDPEDPLFLRRDREEDRYDTLAHSAQFTWDGEVLVVGDEAGGGGAPRCIDVNDDQGRFNFYNLSLNELGSFKIPRPQPAPETCTAHNGNYVPQTDDRDIFVSAWYMGGTSVADATAPAGVKEIGFYEAHNPDANTWSSYWYNGFIYANDITRGLDVFAFNDRRVENAVTLSFLNPQTQMNTIPQARPRCRKFEATMFGTSANDLLIGTAGRDVIAGLGGNDRIFGKQGRDLVCGGGGNDRIQGNAQNDRLFGQAGRDRLNGGPGFDQCVGGPGRDRAIACQVERGIP